MPVPTDIADLSTTASSNSPAGSDIIGTSFDDYFRAIQAILKQTVSLGTSIASATTVTIPDNGSTFAVTGTTTITGFNNSWDGRTILLRFDGALTLTHNGSSFVLPGAVDIKTAANDLALFVYQATGVWRCVNFQHTSIKEHPMRSITLISSGSGTYTVPANVNYLEVECGGGGGGSGGVDGQGAGTSAVSGGGGAGAYCYIRITSPEASYSYAVGAAGAGGASGNNNGTAGGNTTFTGSSTSLVANGGGGGTGMLGSGSATSAAGGATSAASGGDINRNGKAGMTGLVHTGGAWNVAMGGTAPNEVAGSGGDYVVSSGSATNYAGRDGEAGKIRIYEYY